MATTTSRTFKYDGRTLPDPGAELSVDAVRQHYADFFPELSNAEVTEKKAKGETTYEFKKRVGTKGAPVPNDRIHQVLRDVPEVKLMALDLAEQLLDAEGAIIQDKLLELGPEMALAEAQAGNYITATATARDAIRKVPARAVGEDE